VISKWLLAGYLLHEQRGGCYAVKERQGDNSKVKTTTTQPKEPENSRGHIQRGLSYPDLPYTFSRFYKRFYLRNILHAPLLNSTADINGNYPFT
jgi:hypothetical protein